MVEGEESDHGYVKLRDDSLAAQVLVKKNEPNLFQFPSPPQSPQLASANPPKMKISLSQEQLKVKTSALNKQGSLKDKLGQRKVSLQSPVKVKVKHTLLQPPAHQSMTNNSHNKSITKEAANNSRDWSRRIICQLCNKPFVDPRVLSCLHTFCLLCLQRKMDYESDGPCEII